MSSKLTYLKAIERALQESERPLSAREIHAKLLENDLLSFAKAKSPWTAVRARISEDIKRNKDNSKFIRTRRGIYTLREKLASSTTSWVVENRSFFLVIEGLDGSGKTELAHRLAELLEKTHPGRVLYTFEPHDTSSTGYLIRQLIRREDKDKDSGSAELLALAFATNRTDHYERLIEPFLSEGDMKICICDRYYLSSMVYQSSTEDDFEKILSLNSAVESPDLTIFLNASTQTCMQRMKKRQEEKERFEKNLDYTRDKYRKAIDYLRSSKYGETILEVNADGDLQEVVEEVGRILTGPNGADWIVFQPQLAIEDTKMDWISLSQQLTISDFSSVFMPSWRSILAEEDKFINENVDALKSEVLQAIYRLGYDKIAGLFIDYLRLSGYQLHGEASWTEVDAFRLEYRLPHLREGIELKGVAIILGDLHRQSTVTKRILDEHRHFDFSIVLDLRGTQLIPDYSRDPLIEGEKLLPPAMVTLTRKDFTDLILVAALKCCWEQASLVPAYRTKVNQIVKLNGWEQYWRTLTR